jgi:hypothetical protein
MKTDFVIIDRTNVAWPGALPYRSTDSPRGYASREDAEERLSEVLCHYNAKCGCSPGDLRVVERTR